MNAVQGWGTGKMTEKPFALRSMPPIVSTALGFFLVWGVVYTLALGSAIIIPFVIAVFVWYLINAMANGLGHLKWGQRQMPRFLCFVLSIAILSAGIWEIIYHIGQNLAQVARSAPVYQIRLLEMVNKGMEFLRLEHEPTVQELIHYIDLGGTLRNIAAMLSGLAGKTIIVMFYTGFLLYEQRFFRQKISGIVANTKMEKRINGILKDIDLKMQRYIWVKTLMSVLTGLATFLVLRYWKVDFDVFWGLLALFLNFIPYVGSLLAIALPSAIALVQFGDPSIFLKVVIGLSVVQIVIGQGLDPYLLGQNLNLSPIFIISSLALWGMIWGVPGMLLSIPILSMLVITLSQFPKTRPVAILMSKDGILDAIGTKDKKADT